MHDSPSKSKLSKEHHTFNLLDGSLSEGEQSTLGSAPPKVKIVKLAHLQLDDSHSSALARNQSPHKQETVSRDDYNALKDENKALKKCLQNILGAIHSSQVAQLIDINQIYAGIPNPLNPEAPQGNSMFEHFL